MFADMKNGVISIKMFGCLDSVAERCGVKDKYWAKATGIHATRISEIRRLHRDYLQNGEIRKIGRAFTVQKYRNLLKGRKSLCG